MESIIYKHGKNEVAIVYLVASLNKPLHEIAKTVVPANHEWVIIDSSSIPKDETFRDAWIYNNKKIEIDLHKSKEIWKNKFRVARTPILEKLDVEYIRALESGDIQKQQEITSKKQALRDITNIELPDDLEGIKNTWPDILK